MFQILQKNLFRNKFLVNFIKPAYNFEFKYQFLLELQYNFQHTPTNAEHNFDAEPASAFLWPLAEFLLIVNYHAIKQ